jgi:hypothetical protein
VAGQMDHSDIGEAVQGELHAESGQKKSEHFFSQEHPARVEMVADPARPSEHNYVQNDHYCQDANHDGGESEGSGLSRDGDQRNNANGLSRYGTANGETAVRIGSVSVAV